MLIVFAFSITPRKYLHDIVANHKDSFFVSGDDGALALHKAAVNCHTDSIVAESPFANDAVEINISTPVIFSEKQPAIIVSCITAASLFSRLRGPPSLV